MYCKTQSATSLIFIFLNVCRLEDPTAKKSLTEAPTGRTGGAYAPPHKLARLRQVSRFRSEEHFLEFGVYNAFQL